MASKRTKKSNSEYARMYAIKVAGTKQKIMQEK